jgi:site-specific recombinase XerD
LERPFGEVRRLELFARCVRPGWMPWGNELHRWDPMSVQRIVKPAAIRARLPKAVSPHWLRHAHCSHALDRGANPALVRGTAGHADLRVTSVYSHAQPNEGSSRFLIG